MIKKDFRFLDSVVISRTGQPDLDGRTGYIIGVASQHIIDCYIVDLGEPLTLGGNPHTFSAVVFPESCLDRVS